jgi:surface protein
MTRQTTADNQTLKLPVPNDAALIYSFQIDWGDCEAGICAERNVQAYNGVNQTISHTYATSGNHTIKIWGIFPRLHCGYNATTQAECKKLVSIDQRGDNQWTSMNAAFYGASGLVVKASDTPNLAKVMDMSYMFRGVTNLTGNFSGWDTSKITNMQYVFQNAANFDQNLSSWNVERVTNFTDMLYGTYLSPYNYNALLDSRSQQALSVSVIFRLP